MYVKAAAAECRLEKYHGRQGNVCDILSCGRRISGRFYRKLRNLYTPLVFNTPIWGT